ncbi:MAG TPA: FHA domain-containing serine/threonine-protein kinase [Allocoleopsis sp.]
MIGQFLARRYQIIRVLGAGGFSQTYVAQDTHIPGNPTCVVKQLKLAGNYPHLLETARQLFQREAETLVKLGHHKQIPKLLAYFEEDQEFYLVQEFIEGHTLATELQPERRLSESQVIQLLEDILNILAFVHSQGVIHRDIKPENIMRREADNKLVLIDFGAIKRIQNKQLGAAGQEQHVATSTRIGTPGYTPTEQDRGKPRPCSDIYALGMVGIQALTGVSPSQLQEDEETGEIIWQHQALVSPPLTEILTKMVRYHFKERYQSAAEVLRDIRRMKNAPSTPVLEAPIVDRVSHQVNEIILEWVEQGQPKTRSIRENQPSKHSGAVRIGRDPTVCDIVLPDATVSKLHVEIFFNPQQRCFSLRTLNKSNPPIVDGEALPTGEVALHRGSRVRLGYIELRVADITLISQTAHGRDESTPQADISSQPEASAVQQPVIQTVRQNSTSNSSVIQAVPIGPVTTQAKRSTSTSKVSLLLGIGITTLVSAGGAYAYLQWHSKNPFSMNALIAKFGLTSNSNPTDQSTSKSDSTSKSKSSDLSKDKSDSNSKSKSTATSEDKSDSNSKSDSTNTPTINPNSTQQPSDDGPNTLAKARARAKSGDFQEAIALAIQIPFSSSAYRPAQTAIASWQQQQQQQQQNLSRQQSDTQARTLLAKARDIAQNGDLEAAIRIAQEAMTQASLNGSVYREAQSAIARWQRGTTTKTEPRMTTASYKCYCQSNDPNAQQTKLSTQSQSDLSGSDCTTDKGTETEAIGFWKCEKQ